MDQVIATSGAEMARLPIWRSIGRPYVILFRNLPAVIAIFAPMLISWLPLGLMKMWLTADTADTGRVVFIVSLIGVTLGWFVGLAALQYATLDYLNHGVFSAGAGCRRALQRFFPLLGLMLIIGIGGILALGLFVVPFLILLPVYCLALIVFIGEDRGVLASFSRSAELTAGHRWRILGIQALAFLATLAIALLLAIPKILFSWLGFVIGEAAMEMISILLCGILPSLVSTVLYHTLRHSRADLALSRHNPVL